jgi:NAD(P)H-nitrite reductase large subunit
MKVHARTIELAIEQGARTVDELRERTRASSGCGTCRPDLEAMLAAAARRRTA